MDLTESKMYNIAELPRVRLFRKACFAHLEQHLLTNSASQNCAFPSTPLAPEVYEYRTESTTEHLKELQFPAVDVRQTRWPRNRTAPCKPRCKSDLFCQAISERRDFPMLLKSTSLSSSEIMV